MVCVVSRMVWLVMWGNEQNLKGGHAIGTGLSFLMPGFYPKPAYVIYEGKSLNNRNFIITFLQEYLQKLFVSYFST